MSHVGTEHQQIVHRPPDAGPPGWEPDATTRISVPAAILLGVAVTAATTLAVIIAVQYVQPLAVHEGTTALLAALVAMAGTGTIICVVSDRVMRRLNRLEAVVLAHRVAPAQRRAGSSAYWQVYADVMDDLGGLDEKPPSGS